MYIGIPTLARSGGINQVSARSAASFVRFRHVGHQPDRSIGSPWWPDFRGKRVYLGIFIWWESIWCRTLTFSQGLVSLI